MMKWVTPLVSVPQVSAPLGTDHAPKTAALLVLAVKLVLKPEEIDFVLNVLLQLTDI
jgi:hypothetical protein